VCVFVCVCVCFDVGFWGVSLSLPPALSRVLLKYHLEMLTHVPAAPQPRATALLAVSAALGSAGAPGGSEPGQAMRAQPRASAGALGASTEPRDGGREGREGSGEPSPRLQRSPSLPI